jgi:hypothetical protein
MDGVNTVGKKKVRVRLRERKGEGEGMGEREKRVGNRERGGGYRKLTDREEFRFPRFSNAGTPWEAKRKKFAPSFQGMLR